ncbi:MAG: PQQ-binding-like beta-propeller repeat protein [Halorientalis sp.]
MATSTRSMPGPSRVLSKRGQFRPILPAEITLSINTTLTKRSDSWMTRFRREFLSLLSGAVVTSAGCFGGTTRNETETQTETPTTTFPRAAQSNLRWRYQTGYYVYSSPTISDGTLYVGSEDHYLYALDAKTGELQWRFETGDAVNSSPVVHDGTVYFGSDDGNIYALNLAGVEKWHFHTGNVIFGPPTVANGTVYKGSDDGQMYALEAETGKLRWRQRTGAISGPAVVTDGRVYAGSANKTFYALDASSGSIPWTLSLDGPVYTGVTLKGKSLYFASGKSIYAVRTDGSTRWSYSVGAGDSIALTPAVAHGLVYAADDQENAFAIDAQSGHLAWKLDLGNGIIESSPAVANGLVYYGHEGEPSGISALDARTGEVRWRYTVDDIVESSPLVHDDTVYFGCWDDYVYAIDATPKQQSRRTEPQHTGTTN